MVTIPKFCSNCGSPLDQDSQLCPKCNAQIQTAPAQAAAEPIVGIINLQRRKGFLGMSYETFNMIVTPKRLVMVFLSGKEMKEAIAVARDEARAAGKGVLGQWAAQMGWLQVIFRRYQETPLDTLLAQTPGSFVIPSQEVRSIRLKDYVDLDQEHGRIQQRKSEMVIETTAGKQKWDLPTMEAKEARAILQRTLGGIVR